RRRAARRQEDHPGRDRLHVQHRRAPGGGGGSHPEFRQRRWPRERHRRCRLWVRHICRPRAGRQQDCLAQAAILVRRCAPRLATTLDESRIVTSQNVRLRAYSTIQPSRILASFTTLLQSAIWSCTNLPNSVGVVSRMSILSCRKRVVTFGSCRTLLRPALSF